MNLLFTHSIGVQKWVQIILSYKMEFFEFLKICDIERKMGWELIAGMSVKCL